MCRYITRPAVSTKRLSMTRNGQVRYELKTPWRNGTTHVIFERERPDHGAELHIDSAEGEIVSDFEVDVQPSKPVVSRETGRHGLGQGLENL